MGNLQEEARRCIDGIEWARNSARVRYLSGPGVESWLVGAFDEKISEVLCSRLSEGRAADTFDMVIERMPLGGISTMCESTTYNPDDYYVRGMPFWGGDSTVFAWMLDNFPLRSGTTIWGDFQGEIEAVQASTDQDCSDSECRLTREQFMSYLPVEDDMLGAFPEMYDTIYMDVVDMGYDVYSDAEYTSYVVLRSKKLLAAKQLVQAGKTGADIESLLEVASKPFFCRPDDMAECNGELFLLYFLGSDGYRETSLYDVDPGWYSSCILLDAELSRIEAETQKGGMAA